MCLCMYVGEREREREKTEGETERENTCIWRSVDTLGLTLPSMFLETG